MNNSYSIKTITKLNRLTKDDKIIWSNFNSKPTSLIGGEELNGVIYYAKVLDKSFIIYRYKYVSYNYDGDASWASDFRLDFINNQNITEWSFPSDVALSDLYETIQFKLSKAEKFFDEFLDDEDKKNDSTWF